MLHSTAIPPESTTALDYPFRNEKEGVDLPQAAVQYSSTSTLEQLPGSSAFLGVEATGEVLGQLFSQHPGLPGVILFEGKRFAGVISQAHYYKCISRAFGREIYYRRSAAIMLAELTTPSLILSSVCAIPTAVEQCLARPVDAVYEPFLVHDLTSGRYRLCSFQNLLLASSQLAALRNRQMEQILNSVTDGLLVIDRNFRIGGEYSKVVGKLFERSDLRDVPLPEVLRPHLDAVTYEQLQDYLKILFDPKLIDRLIKSINPAKQISALFATSEPRQEKRVKHFTLNFERIRTQADISQVLVRIEDITQRINLARELEQQEAAAEEKLQLVLQILQVEPDALKRFLASFDEALDVIAHMFTLPEGRPPMRDAIHSLFRHIHTLKGEASLLRLAAHERALHQFEDRLETLRSAPPLKTGDLASLRPSWEILQKLSDHLRQTFDQFKHLGASAALPAPPSPAPAPAKRTGLVVTLSRLIADLSERLGKPVDFHSTVQDHDVPQEHADVLHEVLLHLARNSMVHGIESAEQRTARGKNPRGLLQLDLKSHFDCHEIIFQDDGNGLDDDKIRRRAEQLGWNLVTPEDLRAAIFEPGFSTADQVTDLAGRGVGLDAIRHALRQTGGSIVPHSEYGAYCAFQILLPKGSRLPAV